MLYTAAKVLLELMLPQPYHGPSHVTEPPVIPGVPFQVFGYFRFPEIRDLVFPCWEPVSVPEIAVDENGYLGLGENDIRFAGKLLEMLAEPETPFVKFRAHAVLQSRVLPLDAGHAIASLLGCQVVRHIVTALGTG